MLKKQNIKQKSKIFFRKSLPLKVFQVCSWRFTLQNLLRIECDKRASQHTSFMYLCKRPEKVHSAFCNLHYWKLCCNNVIYFPRSFFTPWKFSKNNPQNSDICDLISLWFSWMKHKVLTYIYRVQSSVWRLSNYRPRRVCTSPPLVRGEVTLAGWRWGGGSIFRKTPHIGLASYSIIPLRNQVFPQNRIFTV